MVPAWRAAAWRYGTARRLERAQLSRFGLAHLLAWRARAVLQQDLRREAVARWKARGRAIVEVPFRAW